jgi:hypothetical protein
MASVTDVQRHVPLRGWSERIVSLHMVAPGVHTMPVSPPLVERHPGAFERAIR